jgi:hypothetical protein
MLPIFADLLLDLVFDSEDGGNLHFPELHGITSQKIIFFIVTAIRT